MKKIILSSFVALLSFNALADAQVADKTEAAAPAEAEKAAEAAAPATAENDQCKVVIEANDAMQFNVKEFTIKKDDCAEFTVELDHVGKAPAAAMGHNVVITKTADAAAVGTDGLGAGPANNYVKEGDERVLAHTKLIGGGEKDSVTFKTDAFEKGGDYEFFCSYPGHIALMKGKVIVE